MDSTATVQSLDPRIVKTTADAKGVRADADYRVAAWDVGRQPVLVGDIVVRLGSAERRVPIAGYAVYVSSVLPVDSTKRVPKAGSPVIRADEDSLVVLGAPRACRRDRCACSGGGGRIAAPTGTRGDRDRPYERAQCASSRASRRWPASRPEERGRYVALTVEVLRGYLADRLTTAPLSLTTGELVTAMRVGWHGAARAAALHC